MSIALVDTLFNLMEWTLCKQKYVGKSEKSFNVRRNNHRKDAREPDAILAYRHF